MQICLPCLILCTAGIVQSALGLSCLPCGSICSSASSSEGCTSELMEHLLVFLECLILSPACIVQSALCQLSCLPCDSSSASSSESSKGCTSALMEHLLKFLECLILSPSCLVHSALVKISRLPCDSFDSIWFATQISSKGRKEKRKKEEKLPLTVIS